MKYTNSTICLKMQVLPLPVHTCNTLKSHPYSAKAFIDDPYSVPECLVRSSQAPGQREQASKGAVGEGGPRMLIA
jgi:hypothetical protein